MIQDRLLSCQWIPQKDATTDQTHWFVEWVRTHESILLGYCHELVQMAYYSVIADEKPGLPSRRLSKDGVHPNETGYALMGPLAEEATARAMKSAVPPDP